LSARRITVAVEFVATTAQLYDLAAVNVVPVRGEVAPDADRVVTPSLDVHVAVKLVMARAERPIYPVPGRISEKFPFQSPKSSTARAGPRIGQTGGSAFEIGLPGNVA
jgi:hypothetical protein